MTKHHRQHVISILTSRNYPNAWVSENLYPIDDDDFKGFGLKSRAGNPFIVFAVNGERKIENAEAILKSAVSRWPSVGVGIATDGNQSRYFNRRFDSDKYEQQRDLESYSLGPSASLNVLRNLNGGLGRILVPLTDRVDSVFFEIHSHIRDIDGLHADEALDELCKILYSKLYDEEQTASGEPYRLQRWLYGTSEECASVTRDLYLEASEYDTRVFSLKIPGYKRSRGVFSGPIRLSSAALVKAVEALQDYSISASGLDVKGRAFQRVLGPVVRSGMGQYFTPDPIVRLMTKIAQPKISELILDPFCGSGHFLTSCLQQIRSSTDPNGKAFHEFAFGKLHGIEKSDRMVRVAMTDMRLHGDGHSNVRCTDSLLPFSNYVDVQPESFDLILTNPPFGSLLGLEAQQKLGPFAMSSSKRSIPLETLGLERSLQFLRPGGRLLIILPDGLLVNKASSEVRAFLLAKAKLRGILSLPVETFSPFGANVKTSIVVLRKWRTGENQSDDYPVFMSRIDSVGYDSTGRTTSESELDVVERGFSEFLQTEGW